MTEEKQIFIIGKLNLNGNKSPFIEIVLDTASGRTDGEIVLLRQLSNQDNDYYTKKIPFEFKDEKRKRT